MVGIFNGRESVITKGKGKGKKENGEWRENGGETQIRQVCYSSNEEPGT